MSKHKFFDAILRNDKKLILISEIGNIAKNHFVANFRKQGFVDENLQPWKAVQRWNSKSKSKATRTNPILQGKGAGKLRKIKVTIQTYNTAKVHTGADTAKYAKVHNEGLKSGGSRFKLSGFGATEKYLNKQSGRKKKLNLKSIKTASFSFGKKGFRMPKRQFIGNSKALDKKVKSKIKQQIKRFM